MAGSSLLHIYHFVFCLLAAGNHVVVNMPDEKGPQPEPPHPRQHVTMPTGVAETAFAEDPEAEEAAAALQNDAFLDSPAAKANQTTEIEGELTCVCFPLLLWAVHKHSNASSTFTISPGCCCVAYAHAGSVVMHT